MSRLNGSATSKAEHTVCPPFGVSAARPVHGRRRAACLWVGPQAVRLPALAEEGPTTCAAGSALGGRGWRSGWRRRRPDRRRPRGPGWHRPPCRGHSRRTRHGWGAHPARAERHRAAGTGSPTRHDRASASLCESQTSAPSGAVFRNGVKPNGSCVLMSRVASCGRLNPSRRKWSRTHPARDLLRNHERSPAVAENHAWAGPFRVGRQANWRRVGRASLARRRHVQDGDPVLAPHRDPQLLAVAREGRLVRLAPD